MKKREQGVTPSADSTLVFTLKLMITVSHINRPKTTLDIHRFQSASGIQIEMVGH